MNYVCLRTRIFLKIFRLREKPVRPFLQFWYVQLYSLLRNPFLTNLILNWSHDLNRRYFHLIWSWNFLLFLILILRIFFRLHERPARPFLRFWYVQLCSWMRNLFLKFRRLNLMTICLFRLIWIRNRNGFAIRLYRK